MIQRVKALGAYLWSLVPCLPHKVYQVTARDRINGRFSGPFHELKCVKCGCYFSCECEMCLEPWRDW